MEQSWGLQSIPCPDTNCDYDKDAATREMDATINKYRAEIHARQTDAS